MNFNQNIEKMEDFSQSSTASTIPPEIISYDDDDFLDEIDRVNDLFFGNVELHSTDHREIESNENNIDESDDDDHEQLAENNDNSNTCTSEFSVELSDILIRRNRNHSRILKKKHVGVCAFMVHHVVVELTGLYLQNTEQIVLKQVRMIWT